MINVPRVSSCAITRSFSVREPLPYTFRSHLLFEAVRPVRPSLTTCLYALLSSRRPFTEIPTFTGRYRRCVMWIYKSEISSHFITDQARQATYSAGTPRAQRPAHVLPSHTLHPLPLTAHHRATSGRRGAPSTCPPARPRSALSHRAPVRR